MAVIESVLRVKDEASKNISKAGSAAQRANVALGKLIGLAGGLAVAAIGAGKAWFKLQQRIADSINDLNDMSLRTGVAAETLAGLKLAAEGGGDSLSSLEGSLRTLTKSVGMASLGTGKQADAFRRLDVSVTDAAGGMRSVDDILPEMLSKLGGVANETERNALMMDLMGGKATKLTQALGGNLESMDAFTKKAALFGVKNGPEAAKQAGEWQRAMADLTLVFDRFLQVMASGFSSGGPAGVVFRFISGLLRASVTLSEGFWGLAKIIQEILVVSLFNASNSFKLLFQVMTGQIDAAKETGAQLRRGMDLIGNNMAKVAPTLVRANMAGIKLEATYRALTLETLRGARAAGDFGGDIDDATGAVEELTEKLLLAEEVMGVITGITFTAQNIGDLRSVSQSMHVGAGVGALGARRAQASDISDQVAIGVVGGLTQSRSLLSNVLTTGMAGVGQLAGGNVAGGLGSILGAAGASNPMVGAIMAMVQAVEMLGKEGAAGLQEKLDEHVKNVSQGIRELPAVLLDVIPKFLNDLPAATTEALIDAIPALLGGLVTSTPQLIGAGIKLGLITLPKMIGEAFLDALKWLWDLLKEAVDRLLHPFRKDEDDGKRRLLGIHLIGDGGEEGKKRLFGINLGLGKKTEQLATGITSVNTDGLHWLHKGETVIPSHGTGTGTGMRVGGAGGGPTINVAGVLGPESIRQLIDELNRHLGTEGTGAAWAT